MLIISLYVTEERPHIGTLLRAFGGSAVECQAVVGAKEASSRESARNVQKFPSTDVYDANIAHVQNRRPGTRIL